jgi:hypothetical protein
MKEWRGDEPVNAVRTMRKSVGGVGVAQAVVAGGYDKARSKALDVPLPRPGERLVEIVDRKHDTPFRCGKPAEIAEVGVPTAPDTDPGNRSGCEITGHGERGTAVEGEGGAGHAPVAQRQILKKSKMLCKSGSCSYRMKHGILGLGGVPRNVGGPSAISEKGIVTWALPLIIHHCRK